MNLLAALKNKLLFLVLGVVLLAISAAFSVTLLHRLNHTMKLRQQAVRVQSKINALDQKVKEWLLLNLAYNDSPSTELFLKKEMVENSTYELFEDLKQRLANDKDSYERLLNLELEWKKINTVLPNHTVLEYFSFETKQLEKAQLDAIGIHGPVIDSNFKLIYLMSTFLLVLSTIVIGAVLVLLRKEQRLNNQLIDELRVSKDEAQASSKLKSQILATVSHEIRTPLNGIVGMCEILIHRNTLDSRVKKKIQVIMASGQTLNHIINDILNFSKADAGKIATNDAHFNFYRLCQNIVESLNFQANQKGVALQLDYDESLTHHFEGDKDLISQILYNLVGNAVKFTPSGHVLLQIKRLAKNKVTIIVEDTGIGIEKESLSKIFEPFFQAKNICAEQGTGLGLAICKRLIEMLNGKISVVSALNKGTKFTVQLPLVESEVSLVSGATAVKSDEASKPPKFKDLHMLIAEDNSTNQLIITKMLELLGITYEIAANGSEAVDLAKTKKFDCIFMDCQMPVMDGYVATEQIRAAGITTYIFAMTANAAADNIVKCKEVGMDDFIAKPISLEAVQSVLVNYFKENIIADEKPSSNGSGKDIHTSENYNHGNEKKTNLSSDDFEVPHENIKITLTRLAQETNEQVMQQVLDSFKQSLPNVLSEFHSDLENLDRLKKIAHKHKSSSSLIGADNLVEVFKAIETAKDLEGALKKVNELERLIPNISQYLEQLP